MIPMVWWYYNNIIINYLTRCYDMCYMRVIYNIFIIYNFEEYILNITIIKNNRGNSG